MLQAVCYILCMNKKKIKKRYKELKLMARRYVAVAFIAALLFGMMPDMVLPGSSRVHAASIMDVFVSLFIASNIGDAGNYDSVSANAIEDAIKTAHQAGTTWSSVKMQSVLEIIGETIADTEAAPTAENPFAVKKINPWTDHSDASPGSPYAPGVDYFGNAMNADYTLGQLIIDYIRSIETISINFSDEEILAMYNQLAEGDEGSEGDPLVDYDDIVRLMNAALSAGKTGSYASRPGNEVIDYSDLILYEEFIGNRGLLPGGYLYIGTWIIYAQSLNATFYRQAVQSMSEYDQQIMLYKSELDGNRWKDIAGATGLQYILPIADSVEDKQIIEDGCWVSVFVDESGIPRKADTVTKDNPGTEVDIFNLVNPYDIEGLPELKSLKVQFDAKLVDPSNGNSEAYIYDRIKEVFDRDSRMPRNEYMQRDCEYILSVAGKTGVAFYAADPLKCTQSTVLAEQLHSCSGIGLSCTGLTSVPMWRIEESGAGFLESLERAVAYYIAGKRDTKFNYRWGYYYGGYAPTDNWDQQERLIRGSISWPEERTWKREVDAFGGIEELRNRIWNFQDMWAHYSCIMDEVTDKYDTQLDAVKGLYSELRATGTLEDKELADEAMLLAEKVDAARRARAYENLVDNDEHNYIVGPVLNLLYELVNTGDSHVGNRFKLLYPNESFTPADSITEAVESAITGCMDAYINYSSMALTQSKTIAGQLEYDLSVYVIENAQGGLQGVRAQLRDLVDLENINNGVVAHKSRELNYLNEILPVADSRFSQVLHSSAGQEYATAIADPATTKSTLEEILNDQKADVGAAASELQRFIRARSLRLPTAEAVRFINERINWAEDQREGISVDAFGPYAEEALNDHINWLKDLLANVKQGGNITDEAGELEMKKTEYQAKYLDALDENDLKEADELAHQLEDIQKALDEENAKKNRTAASGETAAERINAEVSNTPGAVADQLVDKALEDIAENNLDPLPDIIKTLEDLGSPGLQPVCEALENHGAPNKLIHQAKEALKNIGGSPFADEYPELQTETGGGNAGPGEGDSGNGTGEGPGQDGGNGDVDTGNPEGDGEHGNGNDPGNGTGPDQDNGSGNGNNGGDGGNGTGNEPGSGSGEGSGNNGGEGGSGPGNGGNGEGPAPAIPDYGPGTGLKKPDFDKAIKDTFNKDFNGLKDGDKAAVVAALNDFANAREDKAAHDYALDLLDELDLLGCPFIYRQYVSDYSREYVSLAAVDKCRRYTKFRMVQKDFNVTMSQFARGSASYVFSVGSDSVSKNNSETELMETVCVSQTDESIRHSKTAKYAYIPENNSGKFLYCTCAYIPETEWAILITPQVDKKIAQLLDRLDLEADGE